VTTAIKAFLALLVVCVLLAFALVFERGHAAKVTKQRDAAVAQVATAKAVLTDTIAGYEANLTKERASQALARKASADYEKSLSDLSVKYDAARAALRAAGGLRLPRAVVCGRQDSPGPAATGAGRPDDAATATVALPPEVDRRLQDLTEEADKLGARLAKLQDWVRSAGLYGPAEPAK